MNAKIFFIFLLPLYLYSLSAQSDSNPADKKSSESFELFAKITDPVKKEVFQVSEEFCKNPSDENLIQSLLSEAYANRITNEQYNNIIQILSLHCHAITKESSLSEKKSILASWIKEKNFSNKDLHLSIYDFDNPVQQTDDYTYEASVSQWCSLDLMGISAEMVSNEIIITWIKEGDSWKINDLKYDSDSPLFKNEKRYDMNKNHISNIAIDAQSKKSIDADITIPLVKGNLSDEEFEDFYPGGLIRWSIDKNDNNVFKMYNGFSWQLTETYNYFFIDYGAGIKFNIYLGKSFAISPEISALAKLNIVFSYLAFGFDTEGGSTFHFYSPSGKELFYLRTVYQHTFIFNFDSSSKNKDSNNFNYGKLCFGLGIPLNQKWR